MMRASGNHHRSGALVSALEDGGAWGITGLVKATRRAEEDGFEDLVARLDAAEEAQIEEAPPTRHGFGARLL